MALFSGRILDAHYIDSEYNVIEVLYEGDDGKLYSHALTVSEDNPEYQALLADGWDQDKLIEDTAEYKRSHAASFNTEVNAAAKLLVDEILANERENLIKAKKNLENLDRDTRLKTQDMVAEVWTHIHENNTDKDMLFKLKLWALEQDFIQKASKEEKSAIRKSVRATQVFGVIDKLLEE